MQEGQKILETYFPINSESQLTRYFKAAYLSYSFNFYCRGSVKILKFNSTMFKRHPSMRYDKTNVNIKFDICEGTINDPWLRVCNNFEETEFSNGGFSSCHRLTERIKVRTNGDIHKDVPSHNLRLHGEVSSTSNFKARLHRTLNTNQIENRNCLMLIMLTIRLD